MREPRFWWGQDGSIQASLLAPFATVYGAVAARRLAKSSRKADVPVVCVGNPTIGGAGKTPTAMTVARMLQTDGERPVFLTRGYRGRLAGPVFVDLSQHRALDVGDEPLLLARLAPTVVARRRGIGARTAVDAGASVIVMDDGFQNPSLTKDFSIMVIDAGRGVGNGQVIPAGPLRAPLHAQLARAHALVLVGGTAREAEALRAQAHALTLPVFDARLVPETSFLTALGDGRVLAFAGIGDPEKFFATLRAAGVTVAATRSFDDHHRYTRKDAQALCRRAEQEGLVLVTTEKDLARMQGDERTAQLAAHAHALPVTLTFDDEAAFSALLEKHVAAARRG